MAVGMAVAMSMAVAMGMAVTTPISASLRNKRTLTGTHTQATAPQHRLQHRIREQQQVPVVELERHMAVAEVIGRLQEFQD